MLKDAFVKYASFWHYEVNRTPAGKSRGFGYASFADRDDFLKALQEEQGKITDMIDYNYLTGKLLGNSEMKLRQGSWPIDYLLPVFSPKE